jgi:hypothetical protein
MNIQIAFGMPFALSEPVVEAYYLSCQWVIAI